MPGADEPTPHGDRIRALERSRLAGVFRPQPDPDDDTDEETDAAPAPAADEPLRRPAKPLPSVLAAHVVGTPRDADDAPPLDAAPEQPDAEADAEDGTSEDEAPRRRLLRGRRRRRG